MKKRLTRYQRHKIAYTKYAKASALDMLNRMVSFESWQKKHNFCKIREAEYLSFKAELIQLARDGPYWLPDDAKVEVWYDYKNDYKKKK